MLAPGQAAPLIQVTTKVLDPSGDLTASAVVAGPANDLVDANNRAQVEATVAPPNRPLAITGADVAKLLMVACTALALGLVLYRSPRRRVH